MIKVLSKKVSDKIAAGEVIDRPVSIVKELTENAVDAGAENITVEIRNGGKTFIRVTDDGCGIEPEETETAFLRHATSKISRAEDLDAVESLGFRGEALASIAAVTRTTLVTKPGNRKTGCRLVIHGGTVIEKSAVGCPDGTTMVVTDLFYNTPVRRKFLKSAQTETSYVATLMEQLCLSRAGVAMSLTADGRLKLQTGAAYQMRDVLYTLYGRETAGLMRPLNYEEKGIRVFGYIGLPTLCRGNRSMELTFVNGRFIKSPLLMRAIEQAYHGLTTQHKFPVAVLQLTMDASMLDVNVHPAKTIVKFVNDKQVFTCRLDDGQHLQRAILGYVNQQTSRHRHKLVGCSARISRSTVLVEHERGTVWRIPRTYDQSVVHTVRIASQTDGLLGCLAQNYVYYAHGIGDGELFVVVHVAHHDGLGVHGCCCKKQQKGK